MFGGCRREIVQSHIVDFLFHAVTDVPNPSNAESSKNKNHGHKTDKDFDERAAGL